MFVHGGRQRKIKNVVIHFALNKDGQIVPYRAVTCKIINAPILSYLPHWKLALNVKSGFLKEYIKKINPLNFYYERMTHKGFKVECYKTRVATCQYVMCRQNTDTDILMLKFEIESLIDCLFVYILQNLLAKTGL